MQESSPPARPLTSTPWTRSASRSLRVSAAGCSLSSAKLASCASNRARSSGRPCGFMNRWKPDEVPYAAQATPSAASTSLIAARSEAAVAAARSLASLSAITPSAAAPAAAETGLALNVPGCCDLLPPRYARRLEIEQVEDVASPRDRAARQPAREDLREARQVRADAEGHLRAAARDAESRDHFIEDQQHAVRFGELAEFVQELRPDRHLAEARPGRLQDHGRDVVVGGQRRAHLRDRRPDRAARCARDARRARRASPSRRNGWSSPTSCGRASRGNGRGSGSAPSGR